MENTEVLTVNKEVNLEWYILQTSPGKENSAKEAIVKRMAEKGLSDKMGEIFIPTEEVVEIKNGKKKIVEKKLYPSYIFIQLEANDEVFYTVKTKQVAQILSKKSSKETKREVDSIKAMLSKNVEPKHKYSFEPEQTVKINEGPFEGYNGVINKVEYERNKLKISIQIFGRETTVELDMNQVAKV